MAEECDSHSFDDSDRFEEDSLCSWSSEPESLCNNWRGWKRPITASTFGNGGVRKTADGKFIYVFIHPSFVCPYCIHSKHSTRNEYDAKMQNTSTLERSTSNIFFFV